MILRRHFRIFQTEKHFLHHSQLWRELSGHFAMDLDTDQLWVHVGNWRWQSYITFSLSNLKLYTINCCLLTTFVKNKNTANIYSVQNTVFSFTVYTSNCQNPSSIYSCFIDNIWEHEFCQLGCWAVKWKFLKRRNFCLSMLLFGMLFSWAKI